MTIQSSILAAPLITCLNHLADKSDQIRQQLQRHADKTVCFRIGSLIHLQTAITQDGHFKTVIRDEYPEVTFSIPFELAPRLASGESAAFREVAVSGDAALAAILLHMGKTFQPEIEESLSSIMGDILARRVTLTGQELVRWHLGGIRNLSRALGEFVSEERSIAASRIQLHQLDPEIELLQQQISQLEKRINALISPFSQTIKNLPGIGQ